jgi:CYTH domain-containing protein
MQIVSARKELIADTEWRQLLSQAIQQTHTYCNFLAQRSQKVSPSGNSFDAQMQRARAEEYFQNMDRTLQQGLNTLTSRINSWIQQVSVLSPVRGAMMNAQASRIFQRNCEFPSPR